MDTPVYHAVENPYRHTDDRDWQRYRKTAFTAAVKIDGPFRVMTSESENEPFYCEDGYLAVDARGYYYAIATEEFEQIYERAE